MNQDRELRPPLQPLFALNGVLLPRSEAGWNTARCLELGRGGFSFRVSRRVFLALQLSLPDYGRSFTDCFGRRRLGRLARRWGRMGRQCCESSVPWMLRLQPSVLCSDFYPSHGGLRLRPELQVRLPIFERPCPLRSAPLARGHSWCSANAIRSVRSRTQIGRAHV